MLLTKPETGKQSGVLKNRKQFVIKEIDLGGKSRQFQLWFKKDWVGKIGLRDWSYDNVWAFNVDENFRNKGLGSLLLVHLIDYARKNGWKELRLAATRDAVRLYERFGFVLHPKMDEDYRKNLKWMELIL